MQHTDVIACSAQRYALVYPKPSAHIYRPLWSQRHEELFRCDNPHKRQKFLDPNVISYHIVVPKGAGAAKGGCNESASYSADGFKWTGGIAGGAIAIALGSLPIALVAVPLLFWVGGKLAQTQMTDERIGQLCKEQKPKIKDHISTSLDKSKELESVLKRLQTKISNAYRERAEEAKRLIGLNASAALVIETSAP